ncbi:MAG: type II toxin-antitoxin system VapC family toxin [Balneolaceae bacterium]|nr:type II toxin-antitoxin system VapC family toxin [Balneolaceae bacterium]
MSYLIDTCCISELIKPRPDAGVRDWFAAQDEFDLYLSVITFGELRFGIDRLPESARKEELRRWVAGNLEKRFQNRILPISKLTAEHWGSLRASLEKRGRPHPVLDLYIAATAMANDLCVVTRNVEDLKLTGVPVVNPWKTP